MGNSENEDVSAVWFKNHWGIILVFKPNCANVLIFLTTLLLIQECNEMFLKTRTLQPHSVQGECKEKDQQKKSWSITF